ncbi:MAG: hypothetical protein E7512_00060 [[Clostridium] sporosphaeroides]|uniref:Uncharacterized protein n=1 Tax=Faecalispora sporosphaeroides TaxID=1549 RepID=A0A928Q3Q4_9FIRM|nr:hypothetical protein [Faecalispora sporosphaeroides]
MPISKKKGAVDSSKSRISPMTVSFVIFVMGTSSVFEFFFIIIPTSKKINPCPHTQK